MACKNGVRPLFPLANGVSYAAAWRAGRCFPFVVEDATRWHVFVDQGHRPDSGVVSHHQFVSDDATVCPHADVVADPQIVMVQPKRFDTHSRVLPNEEVTADPGVAADHNTW